MWLTAVEDTGLRLIYNTASLPFSFHPISNKYCSQGSLCQRSSNASWTLWDFILWCRLLIWEKKKDIIKTVTYQIHLLFCVEINLNFYQKLPALKLWVHEGLSCTPHAKSFFCRPILLFTQAHKAWRKECRCEWLGILTVTLPGTL